jgi:hypothetical protein
MTKAGLLYFSVVFFQFVDLGIILGGFLKLNAINKGKKIQSHNRLTP